MMVCVEREKLRKLLNLYCTILMLGLCAIPCVGKVQGQDIKVNATLHIFPEISVRKHFGKGGFQFVIHSTLTTEDIKCSVIEALGNKEAFFIFENKSCLKDLAPIVPEESVHSGWMKTFNNSVDWNVIVRDLEDYSKTFLIHVEPLNITIHHLMDRLVLMCCLTVDGKREALPMSSLLIVLKSPSVSFNLSRIQGFRKLERYSNPALGEIASCPCDLNEGTCDVYCCCDTNESAATNETNYLGAEMTVDHQFVVWKPGPNNLCEEASKEEVGFGVDIMSGCVLTVADEQLRNCEHLRKKVIDYQSQLFKAEYLSRGGNPDVTNLNDFVKVIRDISSESNSKESRLTLITNHSLWCSQIIQHVQLDVIYSETLGTKGIKVYRIVGARIRYEKGTWKPLLFSTGIHRFIITSGVTFVKMSDQSHKDIKRFWVRKSPYFCNREMCWEEMLFPLTESFSGDPETYVLGWTLCFLLFFIPFVWFTWKNGL
ncbi:uncharacterized protein LOC143255502 isoform X2 [Tachypleus tridentatus]|uniref:uncharacterized protein LOC143255502 isoform X2 n=1 Tax=Tachypleus tridentatus TaxID=6853 RepID=UPI003FD37FE3